MAGLDRKRGADFIAMLQELGGKVQLHHPPIYITLINIIPSSLLFLSFTLMMEALCTLAPGTPNSFCLHGRRCSFTICTRGMAIHNEVLCCAKCVACWVWQRYKNNTMHHTRKTAWLRRGFKPNYTCPNETNVPYISIPVHDQSQGMSENVMFLSSATSLVWLTARYFKTNTITAVKQRRSMS